MYSLTKTDSDNDKRDLGILDVKTMQVFNSVTEDEDFNGFVEDFCTL